MKYPDCNLVNKVLKSRPKHQEVKHLKTLRFNHLLGPPFSDEITIGKNGSRRRITLD